MTKGIYISDDTNEPTGRIDAALKKVILAEPIEKSLNKAIRDGIIQSQSKKEQLEDAVNVNVITNEQANLVNEAMIARRDVITVDDFDSDFKN